MTLFARSSPNDPPPAVQMLALAAVLGLLAIVLMPWLWALLSSFKPRDEIRHFLQPRASRLGSGLI